MASQINRPRSTYERIARTLREEILRGAFADGRALPTEMEVARDYAVSRPTVRRAFQELVADGLVYRVPGRGTFTTSGDGTYIRQFGSIDDLMGLSRDTALEVISPLGTRVDLDAAGRLGLDSDTVAHTEFRRLNDGVPFCLSRVHLPPQVGSLLVDVEALTSRGARSSATIIGLLDVRLEHPIARAEQSVTVATADEHVASWLETEPGSPLLRIDRLYLDTRDRAIELAVNLFVPSQYSYRTQLRRRT